MKTKVILKYANCKFVSGKSRGLIIDLQRGDLYPIPNEVGKIISENRESKHGLINKLTQYENEYAWQEFIEYLVEEEILFETSSPELFPELSDEFDIPSIISNGVVHLSIQNIKYVRKIVKEYEDLLCNNLCICVLENVKLKEVLSSLELIEGSIINSVTILLKNIGGKDEDIVHEIARKKIVCELILFNSSDFEIRSNKISASPKEVNFEKSCGVISANWFSPSLKNFTESLHHNSCLNRKVSIDAEGNIKNCPSMQVSFGNIHDTTLAEAIEKPGFKKYWDINKDKIHVCKDCEFRYICTDCRAFVEAPDDILSKPLKCGYNPYTGKWSEWSSNPLKQKTIDYYGLNSLSSSHSVNIL